MRLELVASRLLKGGRLIEAKRFLSDFDVLAARIALEPSARRVVEDLKELVAELVPGESAGVFPLLRAMQLSSSIVGVCRDQFSEQMVRY
jgi:hypothetical protein